MTGDKVFFGGIELDNDEVQENLLVMNDRKKGISTSTSTSNLRWQLNGTDKIDKHNYTFYYVCSLIIALVIIFDMKEKIYTHSTDNLIEIQECTRLFTINRCLDKVPLTEQMCLKWEKCMAQNSKSYYLLQIITSLAGLVIQSFFENLQLNTIGIFMLSSIFGIYLLCKFK